MTETPKKCRNCGVPHKRATSLYCDVSCYKEHYTGAKTAIEKEEESNRKSNENWINRTPRKYPNAPKFVFTEGSS